MGASSIGDHGESVPNIKILPLRIQHVEHTHVWVAADSAEHVAAGSFDQVRNVTAPAVLSDHQPSRVMVFAGERAPYWNSALRGAFDALDLAHDRRTILRASFESVVFGVYAVYDVMRELVGPANRLLLSGGLTKAPLVRQLLADVFGVPAVQPHEQEASAFGAALLAAQAVGLVGDARDAARAAGYDEPTQPNTALAATYGAAFAKYRRYVDAHLDQL